MRPPAPDLCLLFVPLLVAVVGDRLLYLPESRPRLLRGLADAVQHGLVGLSVCLPLCLRMNPWAYPVALLSSIVVDLDHLWRTPVAWDRVLRRDGRRWIPHQVLFPVVLGGLVLLATRQVQWAWLVTAAAMSHVLRDAGLGLSPLLWPGRRVQLGPLCYYCLTVLLGLGSLLVAGRG